MKKSLLRVTLTTVAMMAGASAVAGDNGDTVVTVFGDSLSQYEHSWAFQIMDGDHARTRVHGFGGTMLKDLYTGGSFQAPNGFDCLNHAGVNSKKVILFMGINDALKMQTAGAVATANGIVSALVNTYGCELTIVLPPLGYEATANPAITYSGLDAAVQVMRNALFGAHLNHPTTNLYDPGTWNVSGYHDQVHPDQAFHAALANGIRAAAGL